jgi:hypothetical protein
VEREGWLGAGGEKPAGERCRGTACENVADPVTDEQEVSEVDESGMMLRRVRFGASLYGLLDH